MGIIEEIFNVIAPHECLGCSREGSLLCSECAQRLTRVPSRCYRCKRWTDDFSTCPTCSRTTPLQRLWTVAPYDNEIVKELIHRLKFEHARASADSIAGLLAQTLSVPTELSITYVPTANERVRERGYDQAEEIARALANRLNRPCMPLLARMGTKRQLGQRREIRKIQMEGAFRPIQVDAVRDKHVLLVDDVLTTGTTCETAARVLRQAGVRHVSAAVFAVA